MKITEAMNLNRFRRELGEDVTMEQAGEMHAQLMEGGYLGYETDAVPRGEWRHYLKQAGMKLPRALRGQGRKPLVAGEKSVVLQVRCTKEQYDKAQALGGAAWVRERIDKARPA